MSSFLRFEATSAGTIYTADSTDVIIGILVRCTHATTTAKVDLTLSGTSLATDLLSKVSFSKKKELILISVG